MMSRKYAQRSPVEIVRYTGVVSRIQSENGEKNTVAEWMDGAQMLSVGTDDDRHSDETRWQLL